MCNGANEYGSDRSRKILKNECLLAKFGVDTEENELSEVACLPPSALSMKDLCVLVVAESNGAAVIQQKDAVVVT